MQWKPPILAESFNEDLSSGQCSNQPPLGVYLGEFISFVSRHLVAGSGTAIS